MPCSIQMVCPPLASRKKPGHEVDGGDGHANPEENPCEHSLRAAFSEGERVLYGRDLCCEGGTGKAEPAKLPGAGIWPEAVPKKMDSRKMEGCLSNSERIVLRANYDSRAKAKTVPKSPGLSRAQLEGATK